MEDGAALSGRRLGPYRLEGLLGQGGMGTVYRARDERLGRDVALKLLKADRGDAAHRERFVREMDAAARVRHPNIVAVHAAGELEGMLFLDCELVEGQRLDAWVERGGPVPPRQAAELGLKLADALVSLHACGLVHRDIKPANVLIDERGEPRLIDFGLAKLAESSALTRTGVLLGTPVYAPLEQLDNKQVDARSDLYGLGGTLYFLVSGQDPFEAPDLVSLLVRKARRPAPPSSWRSDRDDALDAICLRCLERHPQDRYASAEELARALQTVAGGGRVRRVRARLTLLLALAAVAVVGLTWGVRRGLTPGVAPPSDAPAPVEPLPGASELRARCAELGERPPERTRTPWLELGALAARVAGAPAPEDDLRAALEVGAALLEQRDRLTAVAVDPERELLERAQEIATARLAAQADDPRACALRAAVGLARVGAPRRPLGAGRLAVPAATAPELLADLARARAAGGDAAAPAAWLLVDLLATAGQDEQARAALEVARQLAPAASERAALEALVGEQDSVAALASALGALRATPTEAALAPLARRLARRGAPGALESVEGALASEPGDVFALRSPPPVPPPVSHAIHVVRQRVDALQLEEAERQNGQVDPLTLLRQRLAPVRASLEAELRAALLQAPHDPELLSCCGEPVWGRRSGGVLKLLAGRSELAWSAASLARAFSRDMRARSRAGFSPTVYDPCWEPSPGLRGLAACAEFDAGLAQELAEDPFVAALREAGRSPEELRRAREGLEGLRRLEELREEPGLLPAERDALAVEALLRLESLAGLGGPLVLPLRARLRRIALPPALGLPRARLDLERVLRAAAAARLPDGGQAWFLFTAASVAAEAEEEGADWGAGLREELLAAAIAWAREVVLYQASVREGDLAARQLWADAELRRYDGELEVGVEFPALSRHCDVEAAKRALRLGRSDVDRLRRFEFQNPTPGR